MNLIRIKAQSRTRSLFMLRWRPARQTPGHPPVLMVDHIVVVGKNSRASLDP